MIKRKLLNASKAAFQPQLSLGVDFVAYSNTCKMQKCFYKTAGIIRMKYVALERETEIWQQNFDLA